MDKFTLFELHVHDGMEFSATNTAPAIGRSTDDEELEEPIEEAEGSDDAETSEGADTDGGVGLRTFLVGVVALAALAFAIRTLRGNDADLEIADLDDLTDDAEEAEH